MTIDKIKKIEKELCITLPRHYTTFLLKFEGLNSAEVDTSNLLYAKAEEVIEMNRMLGFYLTEKIVKRKLIIGDNGGGDFYLLNLIDDLDTTVYFFDHEETVEKCYDKEKDVFDWSKADRYNTIENYRDSLQEMFG